MPIEYIVNIAYEKRKPKQNRKGRLKEVGKKFTKGQSRNKVSRSIH